jgi:hypothetical protein
LVAYKTKQEKIIISLEALNQVIQEERQIKEEVLQRASTVTSKEGSQAEGNDKEREAAAVLCLCLVRRWKK